MGVVRMRNKQFIKHVYRNFNTALQKKLKDRRYRGGGGARNNGKSHLGTTENYSNSLRVSGLIIGLFMSTLVNYVVPQINFKKRNLVLAITQQRMRYVTDYSVILFLKRFCGTPYLTHVDINNLIMRPETQSYARISS